MNTSVGDDRITFNDGSDQTLMIPNLGNGGVQFFGFIDAGKQITGVGVNVLRYDFETGDHIGIDDVRYALVPATETGVPHHWSELNSGYLFQAYTAPGTYVFGNTSALTSAIASAICESHLTATNAAVNQYTDYYYQVVGPESGTPIPLAVAYVLRASGNANGSTGGLPQINSFAALNVEGATQSVRKLIAASNQGITMSAASGILSFNQYPNRPGGITLWSQIHAFGGNAANAAAYVDPYLFIDPSFAEAHPEYSLVVTNGIGNSVPGAIILTDIASRKTDAGSHTFSIHSPLANGLTVECRKPLVAGAHQLVLAFADPVTVTSAIVTSGVGQVSSFSVNGRFVTLNLTDVADVQILSITLAGVNNGTTTADQSFSLGFLIGDTNGDGSVNSGDAQQTRTRSGQASDATNFRSDVNGDGMINSGDAFIVRSRSGSGIVSTASDSRDQTRSVSARFESP